MNTICIISAVYGLKGSFVKANTVGWYNALRSADGFRRPLAQPNQNENMGNNTEVQDIRCKFRLHAPRIKKYAALYQRPETNSSKSIVVNRHLIILTLRFAHLSSYFRPWLLHCRTTALSHSLRHTTKTIFSQNQVYLVTFGPKSVTDIVF